MIVVVGIGQLCAGGQDLFGQVIVAILVGSGLLLQILYGDHIAVAVISIAAAEFFLV